MMYTIIIYKNQEGSQQRSPFIDEEEKEVKWGQSRMAERGAYAGSNYAHHGQRWLDDLVEGHELYLF